MSNNQSGPTPKEQFSFEKIKYWVDFLKWFIVSVAIVVAGLIIDNGFKERSAGIQEMQAFDKYVSTILKADNIEERWKLSQFFSIVTPTERLRKRWHEYKDSIEPEHEQYIVLKAQEINLQHTIDSLSRLGKKSQDIENLNKIQKQLEPYERKLVSTPLGSATTSTGFNQPTSRSTERPISATDLAIDAEANRMIEKFAEANKAAAITDRRFTTQELFKKASETLNNVVKDLLIQIGSHFVRTQTAYNQDFANGVFSNQLGIVSTFENNKKIWPLFRATFKNDSATFTLSENGATETLTQPLKAIDWNAVRNFIKLYFAKRLDKL